METFVNVIEKPKLKNPVLIEGLPGIGNVGRVATGYLVNELKMKKFAEIYSHHFLPLVILHENSEVSLLKCELYYYKGKRDLIILTGDTQSISPEGHYEFCHKVIDFVEKFGVKEIITLGGFSERKEIKTPRIIGAVNDKILIKKYSNLKIDFGKEQHIGTIVGTSGLLLGISKLKNIKAMCLMGETLGIPFLTDPKAADKVLEVLQKVIGIKINLNKLESTIKKLETRFKKTEKLHKKILEIPRKENIDIKYIG